MCVAISPSDLNYPESLSTLYFADSAKRVKNKAVINEDPNVKLIKDLKREIENLRKFIHINQLQGDDSFLKEHEEMKANLIEKEGKINDLRKAWTEKWQETKKVIEVSTGQLFGWFQFHIGGFIIWFYFRITSWRLLQKASSYTQVRCCLI